MPRSRVMMNIEEQEEKTTTSLTLTTKVIQLLKQDAARCHRSMAGQVQAILEAVYLGRDVELHGTENYTPSIEIPQRLQKTG